MHFIDHKNHIRDDNHIENLRDVTQLENNQNSNQKPGITGVTGLTQNKQNKKYSACFTRLGQAFRCLWFDDITFVTELYRQATVMYDTSGEIHPQFKLVNRVKVTHVLPTQEQLAKLHTYNPETGIFTNNRLGTVSGALMPEGYRCINIAGKKYLAHRLAFLYMNGKFPDEGYVVDHENRKRDDNRWCNLLLATRSENAMNILADSETRGIQNVKSRKGADRFIVRITFEGKRLSLGTFDTFDEAAAV